MHSILFTAASDSAPAGGAAIWEAVLATAVGVAMTLALVALGWAHRSGRTRVLAAAGERASKLTGLPGWAALPSVITAVSLIVAVFGMYWDISIHIADGRDAGPFANPAHFFILFGLFGVFVAGFCAVVLPEGRPSPSAIKIGGDWYAPLGGVGLLAASAFALTGFPLDDFWHRIFGQDVTLWGPTHLMMIGGAGLAFIGQATLLGEAKLAEVEPDHGPGMRARATSLVRQLRTPALLGGFLLGLSTFQAEFDFGVPQFRMLFAPVLIAFAAGVGLVAARIYGGRGMAIFGVLFFIAIRGTLAILIDPILGKPTPHFPLYIAEALLVEAAAFAIAPRLRPYTFGAISGALIGTVGFAAEYGWSHVWMPIPWQPSLIGEALLPAVVVGIAGGLIGGFIASAWRAPIRTGAQPNRPPRVAVAGIALLAVVAVVGYGLQTSPQQGVSATAQLRDAGSGQADGTFKIDPPSAAEDANWLNVTAWQGHGLRVDPLEPVDADAGLYRTSAPIPTAGNWKSLVRIQKGDSIVGMPIYLPEDKAIPAAEVPAKARMTREFVPDSEILQREQLDGVPGWTKAAGYAVVGSIVAAIILMLGWILTRLSATYRGTPPSKAASGRRTPLTTGRAARGRA
jgi:hypothetical protein